MTLMSRKMFFIVAVAIAVSLVATVGRLFVGIPFLPPSGREVVARLSGLPIPVFVSSEDAVDECSPFFCMDYYGRGLIRLDPSPCAKVIDSAKALGWRRYLGRACLRSSPSRAIHVSRVHRKSHHLHSSMLFRASPRVAHCRGGTFTYGSDCPCRPQSNQTQALCGAAL